MLPFFRVDLQMSRGGNARTLTFEAPDLEAAHAAAKRLIADAFGRPGEFVMLDRATGRVTIGAGLWSRNGFYRLNEADRNASQASDGGLRA